MKRIKNAITLIAPAILICALSPLAAFAGSNSGGGGSTEGTQEQQNQGSLPWDQTRYEYGLTGHYRNFRKKLYDYTEPWQQGNSSGGSSVASLGSSGSGSGSGGSKPPRKVVTPARQPYIISGRKWPVELPDTQWVPPDQRLYDFITTDPIPFTKEDLGRPTTDAEEYALDVKQVIEKTELDGAPENNLHASEALEQMMASNAANSVNGVAANQSQNAIDLVRWTIVNFTADPSSPFQLLRSQLFLPMAILLLLAGAVATQGRAIVAQGSPILGDISPFEGLTRSIVAIFLIPGSFLVINYGIDVANSITFTIADEYTKLFGSDMYKDAQDAEVKASPVNPMQRDDNYIPPQQANPPQSGSGAQGPMGTFEQQSIDDRRYDEESGQDQTQYPDEEQPSSMAANRLAMGAANSGLAMTWNILCAFQMAYLYYLWCMGPIAAALWVWPMERLRGAFPSWVEGVVTLCFWSLFWNTVVLLMACFKGVGDTGTVLMTALNSMAVLCVQFAFDFSSLISQGAAGALYGAVQSAIKGASSGGGGQQSSGGGARSAGRGGMSPAMAGAGGRFMGGPGGFNSGTGAGQLAGGFNALPGGGATFDNAATTPDGPGRFGSSGFPFGNAGNGQVTPVAYTGPTPLGGDGGLPTNFSTGTGSTFNGAGNVLPAGLMFGGGRLADFLASNPEALGGGRGLPAWLAGSGGPMDPHNPSLSDLRNSYLGLHPDDPNGAGFGNWLANSANLANNPQLLDYLHNHPDTQQSLGQFLFDHPNMSIADQRLNDFLNQHPDGFNANQINGDPNLLQALGPPLHGDQNFGQTQTAVYDQYGNLIQPPGTTDLTAANPFHTSLDPRNLEFTDAAGHQYQLGQDGMPHLVGTGLNNQFDPVTGLPLHGINPIDPATGMPMQGVHPDWNQGIQPFNPDGPIFARDQSGHVIATYDAHDPNHAGWVGANSGGHVHFDPTTGTGTVDHVPGGSFAYNTNTGQWDMVRSGEGAQMMHGLSVDSSGNLTISGSQMGVSQIPGGEGVPSIYQTHLPNGDIAQSTDGHNWYRAETSSGGTTWSAHALEYNTQAGGFSPVESHGSVVMGNDGHFHMGNSSLQVMETPQGYSVVDNGHSFYSSNGYSWTSQEALTTGAPSYHWDPTTGFSSGSVVSGDHGLEMRGSHMPVYESPQGFTATDPSGHTFHSSNGFDWAPQGAAVVGGANYHWDQGSGFAAGSVVYGSHGPELPGNQHFQVADTGHGFIATDNAGHSLHSSNGSDWLPQVGSAAGSPTYHWDSANGFTAGSVVYGDHGPELPGGHARVVEAGNGFTAYDDSGRAYHSANGVDWRPQDTVASAPSYQWDGAGHAFRPGEAAYAPGSSDQPTGWHIYSGGHDVPVAVHTDASGASYYTAAIDPNTQIYSSDGVHYHGAGAHSGDQFVVQNGQLMAVSPTGDPIPYSLPSSGYGPQVTYESGNSLPPYVPSDLSGLPLHGIPASTAGLSDQSGTVFSNTAMHLNSGGADIPVSVSTDGSGANLYSASIGANTTIASSDGVHWHGMGAHAGEQYFVQNGTLMAISPTGDAVPTSTVFNPTQASVAYDTPATGLGPYVPEASPTIPGYIPRDPEPTGAPVVGSYYVGPDPTAYHSVVSGLGLPTTLDSSTNQWFVDHSHQQVTYDDVQMKVAGTEATAFYDQGSGTFYSYSAQSNEPVVLQPDGHWAAGPHGEIPVHYDNRINDFVPDAGLITPTAHYVEPPLPTEIHPPVQAEPYISTGNVDAWTWAPSSHPDQPAVAFETSADQHQYGDQPLAGLFVADARQHDAPPRPDAPFQPSASGFVPIPISTSGGPSGSPPAPRSLNSIVAGMQAGTQKSGALPKQGEAESAGNLGDQLKYADRRGAPDPKKKKDMTKAEWIAYLRHMGHTVDDEGNIIA